SATAVSFSPCGKLLATSSADGTLKLWSASTGSLLHTFTSHTSGINDLSWSSDSLYLATASDDRSIQIFNVVTQTLVRSWKEHTSYVLCCAYNPQSTLLVSGSFDETVRLWNVTRNKCHRIISAHSQAVTSVAFNSDGTMIVSSSYDGSVRLWDTTTGACLKTLVHTDQSPLGGVVFTPSSNQLICSSLDSTIRMWDIYNSKIVKTYTAHNNLKLPLTARLAHFHPPTTSSARAQRDAGDTTAVVCGSEDGKVFVWHVQSKEVLAQWQAHKHVVVAVAVHPTARIVATASVEPENTIKLWYFGSGS
ncbi:hypothetical protein, partial [Sporisorium scitamineum]